MRPPIIFRPLRAAMGAALLVALALVGALPARAQRLYVVDNFALQVKVFDVSSGALLNTFATPGNARGIAVDLAGNYYVSYGPLPSATDFVSKYDSSGHLVTSWGTGGTISGNGGATGIPELAIDPSGANLLIPFSNTAFNVYSTATGALVSTSSSGNPVESVAYNTSGTSFFTAGFSTVDRFPAAGGAAVPVTGISGFIQLQGMYFQSDTSFFLTGDGLDELRHYTFNPATNVATLDASFNGGLGWISIPSPYGVTGDLNNNLYVSSFNGHTVSLVSPTGILLNGTFESGFLFANGIAFSAIPEPSSAALLLLGAAMLGVTRWRRRRG